MTDLSLLSTASLSDTGRQRQANEDYCHEFRHSGGSRLMVLADGMGGHAGGATASKTAVETIGEAFIRADHHDGETLYDALIEANTRVNDMARKNIELHNMGTTVVALLLSANGETWAAHVGDSRLYRLSAAGIEQLTNDHSVVGDLLQRGEITAEEAKNHPKSHQILRCIGIEAEVEPELQRLNAAPGDRFILCSDGLSGVVEDHEIAAVVSRERAGKAARSLVDLANQRGGPDNVTVQIVEIPLPEALAGNAPHASPPAPLEEGEPRRRRPNAKPLILAFAVGLTALALVAFVLWQQFRGE